MKNLFSRFLLVFQDSVLRRRLLFIAFAFVLFRLLAAVPIPGVDHARLAALLEGNQFLGDRKSVV